MQLGWFDHYAHIVLGACHAYWNAEARLSKAAEAEDGADFEHARYETLRQAGAACIYLHHFADVVAAEHPDWLPQEDAGNVGRARVRLAGLCPALPSGEPCRDVQLLGDVADALKHAVLDRRLKDRQVAADDAVLVCDRPYGTMAYGEGKDGGAPEIAILAHSGKRALTNVIGAVLNAWTTASDGALPEFQR